MAESYTSIKVIADKLLRHPMLSDISLESIVTYCVDFMRIVGVPRMFVDKESTITIENYKGVLPDDWVDTIQIKYKEIFLTHVTDTIGPIDSKSMKLTFKIQGNYIFTSLKEGELKMYYRAIEVDNEGFPMLPDNSNFTRALEAYIKLQHFTILFDLGKVLPAVYHNAQQQYCFYVGSCITEFHRMDLSKAEAFFNSFRTLTVRTNEFKHGFKNNGVSE